MNIIPAIDLIEGKCVRLTQGDYQQRTLYHENPLEVAKQFEDMGVQYLHLVDLDGAKASRIINYPTLEAIAKHTKLQIDFSGGMKRAEDIRIALESGSKQVTVGSIAAKSPELFAAWLDEFGADKLILGADAKEGKIAVSGWQEITELDIIPFIQSWQQKGVQKVICTDISKDGMLEGPSFSLYQSIQTQIPDIQLIASGGVSSEKDVAQLKEMDLDGVIIGKAIYEGRIDLKCILNNLDLLADQPNK